MKQFIQRCISVTLVAWLFCSVSVFGQNEIQNNTNKKILPLKNSYKRIDSFKKANASSSDYKKQRRANRNMRSTGPSWGKFDQLSTAQTAILKQYNFPLRSNFPDETDYTQVVKQWQNDNNLLFRQMIKELRLLKK